MSHNQKAFWINGFRQVLHLNKSLYGLKQAPRIWCLFLCGVVSELGFVALETDSCNHVRGNILLAVYVDDIQMVGPTKEDCDAVYKELEKRIKIEYKGPVRSFLVIDVIRNWDDHLIAINQSPHINRLLGEFGLTNAKSAGSPLEPSLPLLPAMPDYKMCNIKYYQRLTGSLNHLAVFTRPDISFAVSKLSQFNSNPITSHLKAAMDVLRYLKGTRNLCIVYKRQPGTVIIVAYSDAEWYILHRVQNSLLLRPIHTGSSVIQILAYTALSTRFWDVSCGNIRERGSNNLGICCKRNTEIHFSAHFKQILGSRPNLVDGWMKFVPDSKFTNLREVCKETHRFVLPERETRRRTRGAKPS